MKYGKMDWDHMEAVINKLGGMAGVRKFLSGKLQVIDGFSPWIRVCVEIELGKPVSANSIRELMDGCVTESANSLLDLLRFNTHACDWGVALAKVSTQDLCLGLDIDESQEVTCYGDVYQKGRELGLSTIDHDHLPDVIREAAKRIRQPDQWVYLATDPITSPSGGPGGGQLVLGRERDGRLWLADDKVGSGEKFSIKNTPWIFVINPR